MRSIRAKLAGYTKFERDWLHNSVVHVPLAERLKMGLRSSGEIAGALRFKRGRFSAPWVTGETQLSYANRLLPAAFAFADGS